MELFRNKNKTTRFQVLVEIADSGPNIAQLEIARRLDISPQAVSEYIKQLSDENLVTVVGRSSYELTPQGTNWVIKMLREMRDYTASIEKAITNLSVSAAIAGDDILKGQTVGLEMRDGLLWTTNNLTNGAKGTAITAASRGDDVGVTDIEGVISFSPGKVTVVGVPSIQEGGSGNVDYHTLKILLKPRSQWGAIGIEAIVAIEKAGIKRSYEYGVTEAAIEAAQCGLDFIIVSASDAVSSVTSRLAEEHIIYEIINVALRPDN